MKNLFTISKLLFAFGDFGELVSEADANDLNSVVGVLANETRVSAASIVR